MSKKAYVHKSGTVTLVDGDNVAVQLLDKNGKEDPVTRSIEVGGVKDKDFEKMMERPKDFNLERFGVRDISSTELKRRENIIKQGRQ
jgi:argininosuccinate synthase